MGFSAELKEHLATAATTMCRAWTVRRSDGVVLGFTDHDRTLAFDGVSFEPNSGLTAKALAQSTGLSVDNSEVFGALSSAALSEADIQSGRYDGAEVLCWKLNWAQTDQRVLMFRGRIGELSRGDGAFNAELRGLSEALKAETGAIFHPRCAAILGDECCGFDLGAPGYSVELQAESISEQRIFAFTSAAGFADRWFEKGRLQVLSGPASGLLGVVKNDRREASGARVIELWQELRGDVQPGDRLRIEAGCDRRAETCRLKFANFINFRGFPHIPGEDWITAYPARSEPNNGGSMWR